MIGSVIEAVCPDLVERVQSQLRSARKLKKLKRYNAIRPGAMREDPMIERHIQHYKDFYNRVRFFWNKEADKI